MQLHFYGADRAVTGSCHGLSVGGRRVLVDCGLQQGRDEVDNSSFPFVPGEIDDVIVTHAHIDHSGRLPLLVKNGFQGAIYATDMTCQLLRIMLLDAAHIQESDALYESRRLARSGKDPVGPLYTAADAEAALALLHPVEYGQMTQLSDGISFRFTDAGHLLGSAYVELWATEDGQTKKLVFSGDIGNVDQPIIRDPEPVSGADYVIMESTYGDRNHEMPDDYCAVLSEILNRTFARGGSVIIPSFAVGRTQELLFFFREIKDRGLVPANPDFPIVVDSPLAVEATRIYASDLSGYLDEEAGALIAQGIPLFSASNTRLVLTSDESKLLNADRTPKVIIAASGMCDAGRIRHHLKHNLWRPECLILFVGYQSAGTLGRILVDGAKKVKLFNEEITVKARIDVLKGISGHADRSGLSDWICSFKKKPELVFVNHGDDSSCVSFTEHLVNDLGFNAVAPYSGTCYDLVTGQPVEETQGILVDKKKKTAQKNSAYNRLLGAGERLLDIIKASEGLSNKELARFADQITSLCDRLKNQ